MIDDILVLIGYGYALNILFFLALLFLGVYENIRYPHIGLLLDLQREKIKKCKYSKIPSMLLPYLYAYNVWRIFWKSRSKPRNSILLAMVDVALEEECKEQLS